jgi:hypothetical protein
MRRGQEDTRRMTASRSTAMAAALVYALVATPRAASAQQTTGTTGSDAARVRPGAPAENAARATRQRFLEMFARAYFPGRTGQLLVVPRATDGETYGHHFKFGDLCLAHALEVEAQALDFWITNYAQFLDHYPPECEVEIKEGLDGGTSWSCAHGVGRWIRDCGCSGETGWNQKWRDPLRVALDFLRDAAARHFETLGSDLFLDPWAARNGYIQVILDHGRSRAEFLSRHVKQPLSPADEVCALTLLEIQRNSLLMFTSCGWFFSEISGIETIQIMKYAARVIELMDELGLPSPRHQFLEILAEAKSNIERLGTGVDIFLNYVEPSASLTPNISDAEARLS